MNSIVNSRQSTSAPPLLAGFANDDDIAETLQQRNQFLSNFWFFRQELPFHLRQQGRQVTLTIVHNEDDFAFMLKHLFDSFGAETMVVPYHEYEFERDSSTITVVGPGPGNPKRIDDPKMQRNMEFVKRILDSGRKAMFICLGHQLLCRSLGYAVEKKREPYQGVQKKIELFGSEERVGFYNTFVPKLPQSVGDFEVSVEPSTDELVAIRGKNFIGYQFHPESILTKNGDRILKESILYLLESGSDG
ncbi:MAG: aminodeoxychorismate/anthranilate synthase component II [Proteobacteria bacterium]|nr:aminodeoxychorismate/anthranilate synthase component II [Pseudomonadota bacterium]